MGVVVCFEVQYEPWCGWCFGVTSPTCAWHSLGVLGDLQQVSAGHVVLRYAPFCPLVNDGGLRAFGFVRGQ